MQSYQKVDPKGTYPADPPKFSFGVSTIVLLKDYKTFEIDDELQMQNLIRYQGIYFYMISDGITQEPILDPSTFQEGIDFFWL